MKKNQLNIKTHLISAFILLACHSSLANAGWYVAPGFTSYSAKATDSNVTLNAFLGQQGGGSDAEAKLSSGGVAPSVTIGHIFDGEHSFSIETTLALPTETDITLGDQAFATVDAAPLNVFGTYLGKPYKINNGPVSINPVIGAGLILNTFSNPEITSATLANLGNTKLNLSNSVGFSGIVGINVAFQDNLSMIAALGFVTGLNTDIGIQSDASFFNIPVPPIDAGSLDFGATLATLRLQYAF